MFWTVYNRGIKKSTLNGTQSVTTLVSLPATRYNDNIELDRQNKLVFWVNIASQTVESVDYDGNNRKLLYRSLRRPADYRVDGLTFFSPYLFVSGERPSPFAYGVLKLNASNGAFASFVPLPDLSKINDLVVYDSSRQLPGKSYLRAFKPNFITCSHWLNKFIETFENH